MLSRFIKILTSFTLLIALISPVLIYAQKNLPEKYQDWLKLVQYIMLSEEKEVFMQLENNLDRDIFIETFWRQRDPTPGTPQNERQEEHMERWNYANTVLGRGTPREGWMTDQGRIYIILGPPINIERFQGHSGIYPCQVWSYYGDVSKGLPTHFTIIFFQRNGSGEYRLYNSISDGPYALLHDLSRKDIGYEDYEAQYMKLRELAPTLAGPAISMIPGQFSTNLRPSLRDNIILSEIIESPRKDVNPKYATHFLEYKGMVSTEYLTNYIDSETQVAVIQDPLLNINFVHFSISPRSVSIDYFQPRDQYFCNFQLNVSIRKQDDIIFQYSKDFPFYIQPDEIDRIKGSGLALQDSFPIIEGEYQLNILVQNSVGKEFFIHERLLNIPAASEEAALIGPVLGYGLQSQATHLNVPFKAIDKKLLVDPKNTFSISDPVALLFNITNLTRDLWENGTIEIIFQGVGTKNSIQKNYTMNIKDNPFYEILSIVYEVPPRDLPADYYEIKLVLKDGTGSLLDEKSANIVISPGEIVPHPSTLAKSFPLANNYLYYYSLAYQYDKIQMLEQAEALYARAYSANPNYLPGLIEYARMMLKVKKFDQCLTLIESIRENEETKFQYFLIKGKVLMSIGNYADAIVNFLQGNEIYNSDIDLLGSLGFCYYKTGDHEKALNALKASLSLNPDQENIRKLIEEIEKNK